jgi:YbgC/YbaW family acyl-CoA thioester hydrolase
MTTVLFTHQHTVKLHDTDSYGIIFFPNQLRICHDALQEFWRQAGFPLRPRREQMPFLPVVVHAESDYAAPIQVDDVLRVEITVAAIGNTSFTLHYRLVNQHRVDVGRARTVQVTVDPLTQTKMPLPLTLRQALSCVSAT